ncbi:MAG: hypothetical protein LUC31_03065 [Coprobacillus sp.]|nr:hypothetical protein [Coprobacillus sp.]
MKDKLIKYNRTASYYRLRNISFITLLFVSIGAIITIPTYLSNNKTSTVHTEVVENLETSSIDVLSYESPFDE